MPDSPNALRLKLKMDAGNLISQFLRAGWVIKSSQYDPKVFGNWYVDLCSNGVVLRLTKDRSQYFVDRLPIVEIKRARLWKAFDSVDEFQDAIIKWLRTTPRAE